MILSIDQCVNMKMALNIKASETEVLTSDKDKVSKSKRIDQSTEENE